MSTGCCRGEVLLKFEVPGYILPVTPSRCYGCAGATVGLLTASRLDKER